MLATAKALSKEGFEIEYMKVDEFGVVDLAHLKTIVRDDTIFVVVSSNDAAQGISAKVKTMMAN